MGIKPKFNRQSIAMDLKKEKATIERGIIQILAYTGEEFVKDARSMGRSEGGFGDVTGNLRSSIGYFILKDGEIIRENVKGRAAGQAMARYMVEQLEEKPGYQLVGVAGMQYASEVESRGLNVISSQAETALVNLSVRLRKFANKLQALGFEFDDTGDSVITVFR